MLSLVRMASCVPSGAKAKDCSARETAGLMEKKRRLPSLAR
jgi:hypothetical protein